MKRNTRQAEEHSQDLVDCGGLTFILLHVRKNKGFTLIELIIVIIIIAILMGFFMSRVLFYQEQAEKVAMEGVAGSVQSALTIQYGQLLTRGKPSDVAALVKDNPMHWMQKKPSNYAGEFFEPTPQSVESGNWVFDLKTRELAYLVRNGAHLKQSGEGSWIRFHVVAHVDPSPLPSLQNSPPELTGIVFEPTQPYAWF